MHTPGPWTIVPTPSSSYQTHRIEHNKCTVARIDADLEVGDFNANAKLIAAAPELLAALRRVFDRNLTYLDGAVMGAQITDDDVKIARAAIAKAQ